MTIAIAAAETRVKRACNEGEGSEEFRGRDQDRERWRNAQLRLNRLGESQPSKPPKELLCPVREHHESERHA